LTFDEVCLKEFPRGAGEGFGIPLGELRGKGKNSGVMEGMRSLSLGAREIAEFLGKNPAAATGYFRRERGLRCKTERLILFLEGGRKNLNN